MRTSILTRSVVAVATLGIGSVALAATPATAANANGVTREMVVSVANGIRTTNGEYSYATWKMISRIVSRTCGIEFDGENHLDRTDVSPVEAGRSVDGVLFSVDLHEYDDNGEGSHRNCNFAALTTVDPAATLSGTSTLTYDVGTDTSDDFRAAAPTVVTSTLSGDVFTTAPSYFSDDFYLTSATFGATGNAVKTSRSTSTVKAKDKKTSAEKKAAKKKYESRLKSAKKSYVKALDKAGSSKSKKAAAKKSYSRKKASAKAKYSYAVASYKLVKRTTTSTTTTPFTVSASIPTFSSVS